MRAFEFFNNIVNVITATTHVRQRQHGQGHRNRVNHWREAQQRFKLCISIDTLEPGCETFRESGIKKPRRTKPAGAGSQHKC